MKIIITDDQGTVLEILKGSDFGASDEDISRGHRCAKDLAALASEAIDTEAGRMEARMAMEKASAEREAALTAIKREFETQSKALGKGMTKEQENDFPQFISIPVKNFTGSLDEYRAMGRAMLKDAKEFAEEAAKARKQKRAMKKQA